MHELLTMARDIQFNEVLTADAEGTELNEILTAARDVELNELLTSEDTAELHELLLLRPEM